MDELKEYKNTLFQSITVESDTNAVFPEESFFDYVSTLLADAGILDNVEYCPYRNTTRGMRIDGYSWNSLERTICGIVVNFTNELDVIETLTNTEIEKIGKRVTKFFESVEIASFIESLEVTDPGRLAATEIRDYLNDAIKFRVVIFTDQVLSTRVKKLSIEKIHDRDTSIEIWDLERLKGLEESGAEYEEFIVNLKDLGGGIRALPANISEHGVSTYLAVMPGELLSAIYHEYGQRLLESNVRTFLDFRASTNRGMRKSLVSEPDSFFAYNNGLTVTATSIDTEVTDGQLIITSLENMQIVNGGQTTASIYFSPREKGGIQGSGQTYKYSDIDLSKVYVQMKLSVIDDKDTADLMKANIATFANSQNSIQQSDLVSNHPFHLNIETRSRKQFMPAGEDGLSTKWFYERARGQYSTQLRALRHQQKRRFQTEYPKKQLFTKTDMAKYENTWRMKPYLVKKGAQANLKAIGPEIIREYENDEDAFGAAFYNDLISKAILFRSVDTGLLQADWYKEERGLKAEIVTYSIALLRHKLRQQGSDIDLSAIYKRQSVPDVLLERLISLAQVIREHITDPSFTGGAKNPSEFCKSEKGWKAIQTIQVDLRELSKGQTLNSEQVADARKDRKEINKAYQAITGLDLVMSVTAEEWDSIADFNAKNFPSNHRYVGVPQQCANMHRTGVMLSERQMPCAKESRDIAYTNGFDFVA